MLDAGDDKLFLLFFFSREREGRAFKRKRTWVETFNFIAFHTFVVYYFYIPPRPPRKNKESNSASHSI